MSARVTLADAQTTSFSISVFENILRSRRCPAYGKGRQPNCEKQ